MTRCKTLRGGFTLIELLVVIAIIALLISLLVPSMNRAKELARKVACASNVRSIGVAVTQYHLASKGWLPKLQSADWTPQNESRNYCKEISSFIGYEEDTSWFDWVTDDYYYPELGAPEVLNCPSHTREYGGALLSYGWNWSSLGAYTKSTGTWWMRRKLSEVKRPSETSCLGETRIAWQDAFSCLKYWGGHPRQNPGPENHLFGRRHDDGANYLCVDGHVEYATYDVLVDDYTGAQRIFSRGE